MTIIDKNARYLARFDPATRKLERISPDGYVVSSDFSISADTRRIALAMETPVRPPDVWMGATGSPLKQVTRLNPRLEEIEYGQSEDISWKAKDGLEITGVLIKPAGHEPGVRYPLIVFPHGGPEGVDLNGFQLTWGQFLAAHGYAVLFPNFRGGIGRGVEYTLLDNGDLGGKDFEDIMAGVDDVIARGVADPDRLGIGGWSYGGFMSAWAVTQTNRFKAAIMGAGISDWYAILGETPVPLWTVQVHFETWAWDHPDAYRKHSPTEFVQQVKTPVLLFHGDQDNMIPISQAKEYFRALRHYNVPSSLVIFPREGHGVRETAHRIDLYNRMLAWYDKYVKPVHENAAH
jgi:dipeptidyl aminopeptidase/acylaminoacyl peptidase